MDEAVVWAVAHHFLDGGLYALFKAGVVCTMYQQDFPVSWFPRYRSELWTPAKCPAQSILTARGFSLPRTVGQTQFDPP